MKEYLLAHRERSIYKHSYSFALGSWTLQRGLHLKGAVGQGVMHVMGSHTGNWKKI